MNIFLYLVYPIYFLAIILLGSYIFYKYIYDVSKTRTSPVTFQDLIVNLQLLINTEIEVYENSVFLQIGALTSSMYENYYTDMTNHIVSSISKDFMFRLSQYMTEEAVIVMISRKVKEYLNTKIH